jgi:hypothetical protein
VSQYLTEGLDRARDSLNDAAAQRDRYVIGSSVSRRVAAAAASAVSLLSFSSVYCPFLAVKNGSILKLSFCLLFIFWQSNTALSKS